MKQKKVKSEEVKRSGKNRIVSWFDNNIRKINNVLSVIIFILALYLILFPFIPGFILWYEQKTDDSKGYEYKSRLAEANADDEGIEFGDLKPIPEENRIVIPKINIDGEIREGETAKVLRDGIWRRPQTSTPDFGGNTVIISHRRMYTFNPDIFYNLDKIEVGDQFLIFWEGEEYDYEVYETKIIEPTEVEIEDATEESIVTLYTCTLDSKRRILVRARLIEL